MTDVVAAFVVVFLAEMGDKTQLVALTLSGRHPTVKVLAALGAAIAVLQTLSVTVGVLVSNALPHRAVEAGAGVLFVGFAIWTWRGSDDTDGDDARIAKDLRLHSVAAAFFLAELGDKTMLTTAGLAADRGAVPVWFGSFAAMIAATALAVVGGRALTSRIHPRTLQRAGAIAFAVVGAVTLASAAVS